MLRDGDFVKLDFGATVDGYHSDMTRTFVLGHAADWQREIYDLVAAVAGGRPGRAARSARTSTRSTRRPREVIAAAGHGEQFSHGLGHGVGLEIHEAPSLAPRSARVPWPPTCASPSSRACTFRATAVSASRTPSWSVADGPESSPGPKELLVL